MRTPLIPLLAAALLAPALASPAPASAASASSLDPPDRSRWVGFFAGQGEANRVRVSQDLLGRIIFTDRRAPIVAKGDCEQLDRHRARCPGFGDPLNLDSMVRLLLGDRNDRAVVEGALRGRIDGGPGDDLVFGGNGAATAQETGDEIDGGPGDDDIRGRDANDRLDGGDGDDLLRGGDGDDRIFGASGTDHVQGRDGDDRIDGRRGNDLLKGGRGNDYILGRRGADHIQGRNGDDHVNGGQGDDHVKGGNGDDRVYGSAGEDRLEGRADQDLIGAVENQPGGGADNEPDEIRCGLGADAVRTGSLDRVAPTCDSVLLWGDRFAIVPRPELDGSSATFRVHCFVERGCRGTLTMTDTDSAPPNELGRTTFDLPERQPTHEGDEVRVDLDPAAAARLREGAVTEVGVEPDQDMSVSGTEGNSGYRAMMQGG